MAEIGTGVGIQYSNMSPFRIGISQPEAQPSQLAILRSESQVASSVNGAILTQTFTLNEGWNSIYLEVEPINNAPLINVGTAEEPIMAPELSTIEAVFADLTHVAFSRTSSECDEPHHDKPDFHRSGQ